MQDPFRMILISLFGIIVFSIGVLIYKFIYPKKNPNLFFLLILVSLLPLLSILRQGGYESGDLTAHTKISMMFYRAFTHGDFIPQWSDIVCGGYGCPYFIFIYILPYYFTSFFHFLGFSFVSSVKLFLAISFIFSGITLYLWIKDEFGKKAGFIAGLFYLFAPYHLVDLHFRNAVGEMAAFALLPLCFLFTKKIIVTLKIKWILLNAITLTLLMFSHVTALVITIPFLFVYSFIILKKRKNQTFLSLSLVIFSFVITFLLSCFYWLPIMLESNYIFWGVYKDIQFYPLHDLIYSPWLFGFLFQGPYGEHSHIVGYSQLIIVLIACYFLVKRKLTKLNHKLHIILFLTCFFVTVFMILPQSSFIWHSIPFLKGFQFSYRLLIFNALATSVLAAVILTKIKNNNFVIILCIITVGITFLNWGNRKVLSEINDNSIRFQLLNRDYGLYELTSPIWINNNAIYKTHKVPGPQLETVIGDAEITQIYNHPTKNEYLVNAKSGVRLKENTFYYPGWKVFANNQSVQINYQDQNYPGTIMFDIPKGVYKVSIMFTDTQPRAIGKIVSFFSLCFIFILISIKIFQSKLFIKLFKKLSL